MQSSRSLVSCIILSNLYAITFLLSTDYWYSRTFILNKPLALCHGLQTWCCSAAEFQWLTWTILPNFYRLTISCWWPTTDVHVAEFIYWWSQFLCAVDFRLILLQCRRIYLRGLLIDNSWCWHLNDTYSVMVQSLAQPPAVHINRTLILYCSRKLETNNSEHC